MTHQLLPRGSHISTLPADLMAQSARRLRVVAWLYAFVFTMSAPVPALFVPGDRAAFFGTVSRWAPPLVSILTALVVARLTRHPRVSGSTLVALGLAFQVAGSYGIAAAQYLDPQLHATMAPTAGLSWVAVWMLSFTVIVPAPPRWALAAALLSATAVPLVALVAMRLDPSTAVSLPRFALLVVLPYLLVVLIAYVGAALVYRLGADLQRALDLGSYRLDVKLGAGGMGEVWRARHRLLARPAAVKLIRPEVLGAASAARHSALHQRFEREAQTTALLQSPHTVRLFDYGVAGDGTFYYVMELLDGFDLETLVARFGPLPVERAVHVMTQACHSLAEAHAAGLVHRDITPSNVFLCRYGRDVDFVKVLDFGLARPQAPGHDRGGDTPVRPHWVGGTPAFMAPEQALGLPDVDGRADLYALGCLGYWMVTGELVFSRPTAIATLLAHTQMPPVPPSQRTELPIPQAFEALLLACLAKAPADRPPDADTLAAQLTTLPGLDPWTPGRARHWWDIHRPSALVSTLGVPRAGVAPGPLSPA